ncbi:hypothetical protein ACIXLU_11225, partial [Bacteroides fragilis]
RTEKLSLITPMVLRNSGRVGSRRFFRWFIPFGRKTGGDDLFYAIPCLTRIPDHLFLSSSGIFQIQPSVFRLQYLYSPIELSDYLFLSKI